MNRDRDPNFNPKTETETRQPASTDSDRTTGTTQTEEPRMTDRAESDDIFADGDDEGFSLVDPLTYAPLLLVGSALVVFPEPLTSVVGVLCIAAGLFLAVLDLRSSPTVA